MEIPSKYKLYMFLDPIISLIMKAHWVSSQFMILENLVKGTVAKGHGDKDCTRTARRVRK